MAIKAVAQDYAAFNQALRDNGIIFSFSGYVSEKVLTSLGEVLRHRMTYEETDAGISKRVFSIFIEQVQNIIRYSADQISKKPPEEPVIPVMSSGMITVGIDEGRFFVVCGNEVPSQTVPHLRRRLEQLTSMSPDELKALYRSKLREPPDEGSLGGSVGLIEIVRRSSEPVEFDFKDLRQDRSFFCLKAFI